MSVANWSIAGKRDLISYFHRAGTTTLLLTGVVECESAINPISHVLQRIEDSHLGDQWNIILKESGIPVCWIPSEDIYDNLIVRQRRN